MTVEKKHGNIGHLVNKENINTVKLTSRIMAPLVGYAYDPLRIYRTLFVQVLKWAFSSAVKKGGSNISDMDDY